MSNTKIVILRMKEIIYTAIFVGLGLLLILLLLIMFHPSGKSDSSPNPSDESSKYIPGVYTTEVTLGENRVNLQIVLDSNHVNHIKLTSLNDTVATMYPLLSPTVEDISKQLSNGVSVENVVLSSESQYTQTLLLEAINKTLQKAETN